MIKISVLDWLANRSSANVPNTSPTAVGATAGNLRRAKVGGSGGDRTHGQEIKSLLLYH